MQIFGREHWPDRNQLNVFRYERYIRTDILPTITRCARCWIKERPFNPLHDQVCLMTMASTGVIIPT